MYTGVTTVSGTAVLKVSSLANGGSASNIGASSNAATNLIFNGGTFTYTSGLATDSPFTHLAPVAAAFHPMLVAMADAERISGLPIHIIHGDRDWMFPRQMAEDAANHFTNAGANVTYKPITDLSHTYGADISTMSVDWLLA